MCVYMGGFDANKYPGKLTLFFIDGLRNRLKATGEDASIPLTQIDVAVGVSDYRGHGI